MSCDNINCCDGLYYAPDARCFRATFSMGCFWTPEAVFGVIPGVVRTRVGYAGGTTLDPRNDFTGDHAETVDVEYDPLKVTYQELLSAFWRNHTPTFYVPRRKQSIIFYHSPEQKYAAEISLEKEIQRRNRPIKTRIYPAKEFYEAESYHQKFFLQKYPWLLRELDIPVGMPLVRSKQACRLNGYVAGFGSLYQFETEWKQMGLSCEVVEYVRKCILANNRGPIGCM